MSRQYSEGAEECGPLHYGSSRCYRRDTPEAAKRGWKKSLRQQDSFLPLNMLRLCEKYQNNMAALVKNMRRETLVALVFALSLMIMPCIYELLWYSHPDYFRVQAGVNVLPTELYSIAGEYSAYSNGRPLPPLTLQSEQDDAANKILSTYRRFQATSVMLSTKQVELKKRQVEVQEEFKSFEGMRSISLAITHNFWRLPLLTIDPFC